MNRRLIAAIAATLLTVVGAVLIASYVAEADQRAMQRLEPTDVLVVTQDIPLGASLSVGENAEIREVPRAAVVPGALTAPDPVVGLVARTPLKPGEQVLPDRFVAPEDLAGDAVVIPESLVQVTVVLSPERVVGGRLEAGDMVGVVMSVTEPPVTQTILHRVLVSRVQEAEASPEPDDGPASPLPSTEFITLAVSAVDAERIVWVAEHGTLWLTLERENSVVDGTKPVTRENVAS